MSPPSPLLAVPALEDAGDGDGALKPRNRRGRLLGGRLIGFLRGVGDKSSTVRPSIH